MSGFALSVLAGLGLQTLTEPSRRFSTRWLWQVVAVATALTVLWGIVPGGLRMSEAVAGVLLVGALVATALPRAGPAAACLAVAALALNLTAVPIRWWGRLLPSVEPYWTYQQALADLSPPVMPEYRVFIMHDFLTSLPLMQKTSTLLHLPGFYDYDPLFTRRFVDYFNMMRSGHLPIGISEVYVPHPWVTSDFKRRLLDLAAVRYVLARQAANQIGPVIDLPQVTVSPRGLHVFRNDAALARARWVPRIAVIPDAAALLERLASGTDDLASVAFVEEPLPSGYRAAAARKPGRWPRSSPTTPSTSSSTSTRRHAVSSSLPISTGPAGLPP